MSSSPSPKPEPDAAAAAASAKSENGRSASPTPSESGSADKSTSSKDKNNSQSESRSPSPSRSRSESTAPSSSSKRKREDGEEYEDGNEENSTAIPKTSNAHVNGDWQAIWSPQHNAYYFHNLRTNETTWTNPLANNADASAAGPSSSSRFSAEAAALAQGIDPALAHLDPSLAAGPSNPAAFTYTAKFNARTGAFARPDARDPSHVSEYERMKRMSEFYFDVDEWQKQLEQQQEEEEANKRKKKPTKKDLVCIFLASFGR
jgi:hypothetical protein